MGDPAFLTIYLFKGVMLGFNWGEWNGTLEVTFTIFCLSFTFFCKKTDKNDWLAISKYQ